MINTCKIYKEKNGDKLVAATGATIERLVKKFFSAIAGRAGATAGWANGTDVATAQCPASQSASTFLLPINGLKAGDIIQAFTVRAQVQSVGGAVTIDASLRKVTNAATDPTDASLGAITQVAVTAQTASAPSKTLGTAETVTAGSQYYVLVTATTAASTDIQLVGVELDVLEQ